MQKFETVSSRRVDRRKLRRQALEAIDIARKAGDVFGYAERELNVGTVDLALKVYLELRDYANTLVNEYNRRYGISLLD